jgi:nucleoside-diphosphate-sugar epimerase
MRVAVLGGTRFIGVALIEELLASGHEPLVIHRGKNERADQPEAQHAHVDRYDHENLSRAIARFAPDGFIDTGAYSHPDALAATAAVPPGLRTVVLSSADVYRAFYSLRTRGPALDPVPLYEDAVLRGPDERYMFRDEPPIRGSAESTEMYENLDVEAVYRERGATIIRPGVVYGERDLVGREQFVLRRVRARRRQIPIGSGNLLWSRVYVRDVAVVIRLALESEPGSGAIFNVSERKTWTMEEWMRRILAASEFDAELVTVPDEQLPADLVLTGTYRQHVLTNADRARAMLGWNETDSLDALQRSVTWHLEQEREDDDDFSADEAALSAASI